MRTLISVISILVIGHFSWGQSDTSRVVEKTYKYQYTRSIVDWDIHDTTRVLNTEDLVLITHHNEVGAITLKEYYQDGKLLDKEDATAYESGSIYGAIQRFIAEAGLEDSEEKEVYKKELDSSGRLLREFVLNDQNDTLQQIRHYYDDLGRKLRIENYQRDTLAYTRIFVTNEHERWSKMLLINREGDITSSQETKYENITEHIIKSINILSVAGHENDYPLEAIWYYTEADELIKLVKIEDEQLVITEYHYEYKE